MKVLLFSIFLKLPYYLPFYHAGSTQRSPGGQFILSWRARGIRKVISSSKKICHGKAFWRALYNREGTNKSLSQITEEEVMSYRLKCCIPVDENPLSWWESNEHKYPHCKLAQRYLAVLGTAVLSERVFFTAGDIVTACRSRLLAENVDKLIFLQKNMIMESAELCCL